MGRISKTFAILSFLIVTGFIIFSTMHHAEKPDIIFSGHLKLKEGLETYAAPNNTLFIVIYSLDNNKPMPLAVMREPIKITSSGHIRKFSVTPDKLKRMMNKDPLPLEFRVKARLDRDGMGGRDQQGDITAEIAKVIYGSRDVVVSFDKKI